MDAEEGAAKGARAAFDPVVVDGGGGSTTTVTISAGRRMKLTHNHEASKPTEGLVIRNPIARIAAAAPSAADAAAAAPTAGEPAADDSSALTPAQDDDKDTETEKEKKRKRKRRRLLAFLCCCCFLSAVLLLAVLLGVLLTSSSSSDSTPAASGPSGKVTTSAVWVRAEVPLIGGSGLSGIVSSAADFAGGSTDPFGVLLRRAVASSAGVVPSSVQIASVSVNATTVPQLLRLLNATALSPLLAQILSRSLNISALPPLPASSNWTSFQTGAWTLAVTDPVNADAFAPVPLPARRRRLQQHARRLPGNNATAAPAARCFNVTKQLLETGGAAFPVTYIRLQLLLPEDLVTAAGAGAQQTLDEAAAAYLRAVLALWGNASSLTSGPVHALMTSWENCTAVPAAASEELVEAAAPDTVDVVAEVVQELDVASNTVTVVSVVPSPSASPSPSGTPTPSVTPSAPSATPTPSVTPSGTPTPSPTPTGTPTPSPTPTGTPTPSPTPTPSTTPSHGSAPVSSPTATGSPSTSGTASALATASANPSTSAAPTTSAQATRSASASASASPSTSSLPSPSTSSSPTASTRASTTATSSVTSSASPSPSYAQGATSTTSPTATASPSSTNTQGGAGGFASCPNTAPTEIDAFRGTGETTWYGVAFDSAADDAYYLSSSYIIKREKSTGKRWVLKDISGTLNDILIDTRSDTLYVIKDAAIYAYTTAGVQVGSSWTVSGCSNPQKFDWDASWNLIIGCSVYDSVTFANWGIVVRVNPASPGTSTTLVSKSAWQAFETAANGNSGPFSSLAVDTRSSVMYVADFWGSVPMQRFPIAGGSGTALKMMGSNLNGQNAGWYGTGVDPVNGRLYASWSAPYPNVVGGITYYSGLYSWANNSVTGTSSQINAITRTADTRLCCGRLNAHYFQGVGHLYGADSRMALPPTGAPNAPIQPFLIGWYTPAGFFATDAAHYISSSRYNAIVISAPDAAKIGGGISWALTTALTSPRQICGASTTGTTLYVIDNGGTTIKSVDVSTGAVSSFVTGLTDAWACSMDAGGTGDILLVDGYVIKRVPAGSAAPIAYASLPTVFTLNVQHTGVLLPILSVAGDVAKSLYFVAPPGDFDLNNYAINTNSDIFRIKNGVESIVGGTQLDSGSISNTDGSRFATGLFLTPSGDLVISGASSSMSLVYVQASDATTAADFSTKWAKVGSGTANGFVSVSSSGKVYTAAGGVVYQAC